MRKKRVVEDLNNALHSLFAQYDDLFLIGEDIVDPYGGAFKVSKNLSTKFPDRIISTPISEQGILGVAGGLSISGNRPIVEIMFGDFIPICFDQIINFASKSVTMYGRKLDLNLVVRCPVGGNRGYGATHSQSLQKHFIGIPNLDLYELSPFHNNLKVFESLINLGNPCIFFEDKILYTQLKYEPGIIEDLFRLDFIDSDNNYASLSVLDENEFRIIIISNGSMANRCIQAMKELFLDYEIEIKLYVPSKIYPLDITPLAEDLIKADYIFIVEEGLPGGSWGTEAAYQITDRLWGKIKNRIHLLSSKYSIIPASIHLEKEIIIQKDDIVHAVKKEILGE